VTLAPFPDELRPGGVTSPRHTWLWQFLGAEADSTAQLQSFFREARLELEQFIREGSLTASDSVFYRKLLDETNRVATQLAADGSRWTTSVIPEAYSAGWRINSSVVMPIAALDALSKDTLGLIVGASNDIRVSIRQSIAQGILQGLSGSDLRTRIIASGLTNIPHWPSLEYRAGVIARTETMKAFNGGVLAGIESTGASFVRWIISPDEAVCPTCGPRGGKVYRIAPGDGYPFAGPLPKLPAHPRCRCSIRAEYRDPNGKILKPGTAVVPPVLPKTAMGGLKKPIIPPAAGDFPNALGQLSSLSRVTVDQWGILNRIRAALPGVSDDILDAALRATGPLNSLAALQRLEALVNAQFWRGLGTLTADEIRMLSLLKGTQGNAAFANFLQLRYGITWGKPLGWAPELRAATIQALERLRAINPSYVVDSEYLRFLGIRPPFASRWGANVLGRAFPQGYVEANLPKLPAYITRSIRAGEGVNGVEEIFLHEFLHTIHFRYGLYDTAVNSTARQAWSAFKSVEKIAADWHDEYFAIRKATTRQVAPDAGALKGLRESEAKYVERLSETGDSFYEGLLVRVRNEIAKIESAIESGAEMYPTRYAMTDGYAEDFAESGMLYFLNPARLKRYSPRRYAFFRDRVFGGVEP